MYGSSEASNLFKADVQCFFFFVVFLVAFVIHTLFRQFNLLIEMQMR